MNKVINRSRFRIGFHVNKKYNFIKGLTISEILVYTWISILAITAVTGIILVFGTIILNPEAASDAMNASGFHF
jgi:hypothetical protein|tara:strand:- start:2142 stop:2363 length:222 start_codon:yes stop_codon:yes gene_type:complete